MDNKAVVGSTRTYYCMEKEGMQIRLSKHRLYKRQGLTGNIRPQGAP